MKQTWKLSVIIPAYNEAEILVETVTQVQKYLEKSLDDFIIVVIDDGSSDRTWDILKASLPRFSGRLKAYRLSRNFGKDLAILTGLSLVSAEAYLVMDADGQHPPELIPEFVDLWQKQKPDVIHGIKRKRKSDSWFQRLSAGIFNKVFSLFSGIEFASSSDYKLLSRRAAESLLRCGDYHFFFRALANWIGFPQAKIEFNVSSRERGESKWRFRQLAQYAIDALVLYSNIPLYLVLGLGCLALILSLGLFLKLLWTFFLGSVPSGYSTLLATSLLSLGFIMTSLGILGLYMKNILDQVKKRPRFIVADEITDPEPPHAAKPDGK